MRYKKEDFTCKCGCGYNVADPLLIEKLELACDELGYKLPINSGCRCATHNKRVGGVPNSTHVQGQAADIGVRSDNHAKVLAALSKYFDRVGVSNNFIHVDICNKKVKTTWYYKGYQGVQNV